MACHRHSKARAAGIVPGSQVDAMRTADRIAWVQQGAIEWAGSAG